ncbi:MAG: MalY/PatB family protein [Christensenellales bacterium]|jgi:cystathionine beta-lyase
MYDFETFISREGMGAIKWDISATTDGMHPIGVMPFSVADMEFACAPEILDALRETLNTGILGYTAPDEKYYDAVCSWMQRRHGFRVQPEWVVPTYGVVSALYTAVRAFTEEGDGVIIQTPVYPPFAGAVKKNNRKIFDCPLVKRNGRWEMDFDALEQAAKQPQVKLALLCSPHNPVGRVWTEEELTRYVKICTENGVAIVSDEIHFDLILPGHKHTVLLNVPGVNAANCVVCTAPSKTFNLAGLTTSNIIIPGQAFRKEFIRQYGKDAGGYISALGVPACTAAYNRAEGWLTELIDYVAGNAKAAADFFAEKFPKVEVDPPEGTYLMWLDFSQMGLTEEELDKWLLDEALFFLTDGRPFGPAGALHRRLNLAAPRWALMEALCRMDEAANRLGLER